MNIVCKNCNNHFNGKYCNLCGQPADTHEINAHFVWHDIRHSLLHYDAGVIFTIKALMTKPGIAIKDYIAGKRVGFVKPIALVLLMAGSYGFLYHYYHINFVSLDDGDNLKSDFNNFNEWMGSNYATVQLLFLPFLSLTSYWIFRKSGLNFFKHLVLNAFLTGQRLFIAICLFPLLVYFNGKPQMNLVNNCLFLLGTTLMVYTYLQFFDYQTKVKTFFLALLTYSLYFIEMVLVGIGVEYLYIYFFKH